MDFSWCKRGRNSLKYEERSGRPAIAFTDENIVFVRILVDQDRRICYYSIQQSLHINSAPVDKIVQEHLSVR